MTTQLCEALLDLAGSDKSQPFDIGFSWARGLPSDLPVRPINFTTDTIHVLDSGARHLKEIASAGIATITGKIKEMHYDPAPHRVKVQGTLRAARDAPRRLLSGCVSTPINTCAPAKTTRTHT